MRADWTGMDWVGLDLGTDMDLARLSLLRLGTPCRKLGGRSWWRGGAGCSWTDQELGCSTTCTVIKIPR
jgi:hypothetical protein